MNTETKVTNQDKVEKILFWTMIVSVVTFVAALIIYVVANWGRMFSDFKTRVKEKKQSIPIAATDPKQNLSA